MDERNFEMMLLSSCSDIVFTFGDIPMDERNGTLLVCAGHEIKR